MKQEQLDLMWDQMKKVPRTCRYDGKTELEAPHRPTVDAKGRIVHAPKCGIAQWTPAPE